jgi:hypothetical protein
MKLILLVGGKEYKVGTVISKTEVLSQIQQCINNRETVNFIVGTREIKFFSNKIEAIIFED